MQYFGADGLGSVRQIFDASAIVVGSSRYDPFGNVMSQGGTATSGFAFAGEQQVATGLEYLRARYYSAAQGRFTTRDVWPGDYQRPATLNGWRYVEDNPVNRLDPSGRFSEDMIIRSLAAEGKTVQEVFGKDSYGYARWGLYWLLKAAQNWDRIYPAIMPPSYTLVDRMAGGRRTLWLDNVLILSLMGSFDVAENGCELVFMGHEQSPFFKGPYSLAQFVDALDQSAALQVDPLVYWRTATFANHWYRLGRNDYYSDFGGDYVTPDFIAWGATAQFVSGITVSNVYDRFGNNYLAYGIPFGLGFSGDYSEGYVEGPRADEARLKEIGTPPTGFPPFTGTLNLLYEGGFTIDVPSNSAIMWYGYGASMDARAAQFTISGNYLGKDRQMAWSWIDEIRGYSSP